MNNTKIYKILVEKTRVLQNQGYLKEHENDFFVADRESLVFKSPKDVEFFWAVSKDRTWLLTKHDFQDVTHSNQWLMSNTRILNRILESDSGFKIFYCNGSNCLEEVSGAETMLNLFAEWQK